MVFSFYDAAFTSEQKRRATELEELFTKVKALFSEKGYTLKSFNVNYTEDKCFRNVNVSI